MVVVEGVARERAHVLVGLAIAVANIDEVIALIRAAKDPVEARTALLPGIRALRLVHAESDGLPGVIVDRYDDTLVLQLSSAGAMRSTPIPAAKPGSGSRSTTSR